MALPRIPLLLPLLHLLLHPLPFPLPLPRIPQANILLLLLWPVMSTSSLELVDQHAPEVRCSEGLTDCHVSSESQFFAALPDLDESVNVTHVKLEAILCCSAMQDCEPCLQVIITVLELDDAKQVSGESDDYSEEEEFSTDHKAEESGHLLLPNPKALVKVCLSSPGSSEFCKALQFKPRHSGLVQASQKPKHTLLLTERVTFGSPVVVHVDSHGAQNVQSITVPSLEEVCSMNLEGTVKRCDAPRLRAVMDHQRNVVFLQLENTGEEPQDEIMCQMVWNETPGEVLMWPNGKTEITISSDIVAPCLCFQVWWKGKELRRESCPFKHQQEALETLQRSVSVTMAACQVRGGGSGLTFNVTALCRLEAEVWLCRTDPAGGRCAEVSGSRQTLHSDAHAGWRAAHNTHWKTGEFNASAHPLLCVQIKIHGMESYFEPQCPFATSRWRWSLILLIGLLFMCLAILGAYFIQGVLKGYVWRWLKEDDVKAAVGGGHVVLLHPSDDNQALPELVNHLGSSLQALGFSVSLDLWSQTELSVLGPVPWLHSRLNQLQREGGKVVLALTQAAWIRAEEWGARRWDTNAPRERNRQPEEEERGRRCPASFPCVDAFTASLSCVLADYLQGRAGERFLLVQFEALPSEPPGGVCLLPELFRGLHVYSLPSQSLGFLTELAGTRNMATKSARRRRAGALRMASRALGKGLTGFTAGTTVLHFAGVSQSCIGVGDEDSGESEPLQQSLIMPPSDPDASPKVSETDWV